MIRNLRKQVEKLRGRHVLVLGDLILDRYTWGNAERVSPEAPVLVLRADDHEVRPGGAASVAVLLRHLEATVTLAGVVGDDAAGRSLTRVLSDEQVNCELVQRVASRPTTTKERFVGRASNRHPHQILRVDQETTENIDSQTVAQLRAGILRQLASHSAIVISDYAKGVCTPELLNAMIYAAHDSQIPVIVDPARISNYHRYRRASLITPNRSEAELATDQTIDSPEQAFEAGRSLVEQALLKAAFITMDRDGIVAVENTTTQSSQHVAPATCHDVYDITGAGDMVAAVAGLCLAAGWPLGDTARLANLAAGLEIEQLGIAPITWDQIVDRNAGDSKISDPDIRDRPNDQVCEKIVTLPQLSSRIAKQRAVGKTVVFTNGCFDLLHVGHVTYLQEAAELGDLLVVAINNDAGVRRLKGQQRPVICEADRASMLASLACVDFVTIFEQETPHRLLDALRPDVLVKGGTTEDVIGREVVESYGGRVCTADFVHATSTTKLVSRISERNELSTQNPIVASGSGATAPHP